MIKKGTTGKVWGRWVNGVGGMIQSLDLGLTQEGTVIEGIRFVVDRDTREV